MYIFRLHEQFIMKIVLIFFVYFSDLYVQPQIFLGGRRFAAAGRRNTRNPK